MSDERFLVQKWLLCLKRSVHTRDHDQPESDMTRGWACHLQSTSLLICFKEKVSFLSLSSGVTDRRIRREQGRGFFTLTARFTEPPAPLLPAIPKMPLAEILSRDRFCPASPQSYPQPVGHFSVEWWNSGIEPVKPEKGPGTGRRFCESRCFKSMSAMS